MPGRLLFDAIYRAGLAGTMWDRSDPDAVLVSWARHAPGRAVDLGCGTGVHAAWLAGRGWAVDAVDFSAPAVARARARCAGLSVTVHHADVLEFTGAPYDLVVDYGCFHSLPKESRRSYAARVASLAAPGASLVLMAMAPRWRVDWRVTGPAHVPPAEVARVFAPSFRVEAMAEAPHYWTNAPRIYRPLSGPYRPTVYRMVRA